MSADHRVQYDAEAPDIGCETGGLKLHYFGGHERAGTGSLDDLLTGLQVSGQAKVAQFNFWLIRRVGEEYI